MHGGHCVICLLIPAVPDKCGASLGAVGIPDTVGAVTVITPREFFDEVKPSGVEIDTSGVHKAAGAWPDAWHNRADPGMTTLARALEYLTQTIPFPPANVRHMIISARA